MALLLIYIWCYSLYIYGVTPYIYGATPIYIYGRFLLGLGLQASPLGEICLCASIVNLQQSWRNVEIEGALLHACLGEEVFVEGQVGLRAVCAVDD